MPVTRPTTSNGPIADFQTFQQVQTDSQGGFSTKEKVKKTFEYRAVIGESAECEDGTSGTEKVRVKKR